QREFVANLRAILHRLANHDGLEAVRLGIGGGGADASAGRAAGDQQRVDAALDEMADQRGAGEGAGVLLDDDVVVGPRLNPLVDGAGVTVPATKLGRIVGSRLELRLVGVKRGRVNRWDIPGAGGGKQLL